MGQRFIKIGDRSIGDGHPPYVIAEACVNHQGNFEIAKRMVYFAHAMGADAIKFQMHILEDEMLPDVPASDNFENTLWEVIENTNFTTDQHRTLMALCRDLGIQYLCTPFSRASIDVLDFLRHRSLQDRVRRTDQHSFHASHRCKRKTGDRIDRHEPAGGNI